MRSSSEKINSSCTEELSWTDEESGSDHSLAENEVMLYSLLHHEQQDFTVPETTLHITTSSRTKANRLNQVQYDTEQCNNMATRKEFASNNFARRNLSTFNGFNPNRFTNKCTEMAAKDLEGTKKMKKKRPVRLKTKRKQNKNITSVQSLLNEVYKLSADTPLENVITLYDSTSQGPSTPLTSLTLNVSYNASNDCSLNTRKNNSVQSDATVQSQPVCELSGANEQPQICTNELSRQSSPRKDIVPSKYKMQLNSQKSKCSSVRSDIITLDSDNESIDSIIEVKPPTPPPPLVISIDSSDESSKVPLEKNKIVKSFSKSKDVLTPKRTDQLTTKRTVMAETELNPVTNEGTAPPVTNEGTAPPVTSEGAAPPITSEGTAIPVSEEDIAIPVSEDIAIPVSDEDIAIPVSDEDIAIPVSDEETTVPVSNEDTALPVSNEVPALPVSNEVPALPVSNEVPALPVSNEDTALPVINVDTELLVTNVVNTLPGPSTDRPVFVRGSAKKSKSYGPLSTPRSWTKRMTKFYCDSWGGQNFDHQKLISKMSESREKWIVRDADFIPQVKNRRFCNRCKQRGHLQWECFEERKVPLCFMCGVSGHSEPWCPNKICLVCGRPSGAFLYGCQNCYFENKSCAACGERDHYVWQCPTAWRSYHATTSMGAGLKPEVLKDYRNQECCKCAKRGHSAFWCPSVRDWHLSRQVPPRPTGNRNRPMAKGAHKTYNVNNIKVGTLPCNIIKRNNRQVKMKQRRENAKQRRIKRKLRKAEKLAQVNV